MIFAPVALLQRIRGRVTAPRPAGARWLGLALTVFAIGCHSAPSPTGKAVSPCLIERTGYSLCAPHCPCKIVIPPGVVLEDGLTEDEAIVIALCNNAAFQELLVDLRLANADLMQAGLLPNPEFVYFFPVSEKPYKYLFDFPIESLWLRPIKLNIAAGELSRTQSRLVQAGLDLIRDVRQSYSDVLLAQSRTGVVEQGLTIRSRVAELSEVRRREGDVSTQEIAAARIDALQAKQESLRASFDASLALERLRNLMGIGELRSPLALDPTPRPPVEGLNVDDLVDEAVATRPDVAAAGQAVAAAEERLRLARIGWIRVLGIADATSGRGTGHELSPAVRITLPIFHHNQGGISRAEGEVERAVRQRQTLRHQVILEVRRAYLQYEQTRTELQHLQTRVRPEVQAAIRRSQLAFEQGSTTYLVVLETTRQLLDSFLREAQLVADLRRATAELERAVGRRLSDDAAVIQSVETLPPGKPVTPSEKDQR